MEMRERIYLRGREIGAAANDSTEVEHLISAFVRTHPEVADNSEMLDRLWMGIAAISPRLAGAAGYVA